MSLVAPLTKRQNVSANRNKRFAPTAKTNKSADKTNKVVTERLIDCSTLRNDLCPINEVKLENRSVSNFRPLCPVKMNGHPSFALIDSGNVVVNAISEKFARELYGDGLKEQIQNLKNYQYIGTAEQGAKMRVLGMTKHPIALKFGGSSITFHTNPIVIKGLSMDINISGPFLSENQIDQMHSKGALRVKGKLIPLLTYKCAQNGGTDQREERVNSLSQDTQITQDVDDTQEELEEELSSKAYVAKTKEIPANSAAYVQLRIQGIEKCRIPDGSGLVIVGKNFADKTLGHPALIVAVKTDQRGRCFTSLMNSTHHTIEVKEGQQFGDFLPYKWTHPQPRGINAS